MCLTGILLLVNRQHYLISTVCNTYLHKFRRIFTFKST